MSFLLFSLGLFFNFVQAEPQIRDQAMFNVYNFDAKNGRVVDSLVREILYHVRESDRFLVRDISVKANGSTTYKHSMHERDSILDREQAKLAVEECEEYGGTQEEIVTPAGRFMSCHLFSDDDNAEETWIAEVPFGVARIQIGPVGKIKTLYELVDFHFGP